MTKTNVIIDTDMGVDDIMAITMLIQSRLFTIKAISTVFGVATASNGAINLSRIMAYLREDIPIYEGAAVATNSAWNAAFPPNDCIRANKLTLLSKLPIPRANNPCVNKSIDVLYQYLQQESGSIKLVCLGPLTNIAYLINRYGQPFTDKIEQIFMMGGAVTTNGNVPPFKSAEYNIYLDPEAADTVFSSTIPITLVPIDATKWVPASTSFVNQVKKSTLQTKTAKIIQEIIINNNADFDSFYDPLVSAIMLDSSIIQEQIITNIDVVVTGPNRGQTFPIASNSNNVTVITKIDAAKFYQLIQELSNAYNN